MNRPVPLVPQSRIVSTRTLPDGREVRQMESEVGPFTLILPPVEAGARMAAQVFESCGIFAAAAALREADPPSAPEVSPCTPTPSPA